MIIARIESSKSISDILNNLAKLKYEVSSLNDKSGYVFRKIGSVADLSRDIKSAKITCEFSGVIKVSHGTSSSNY